MLKIKNIIILVVVAVVLIFSYLFFFKKSPDEQANLDSSFNAETSGASTDVTGGIAGDFLTVLLNVKNITLDDSIFSDPVFATLHDSSIELIPDGTEGRPNPFAPIGVDVAPVPVIPPATSTPVSIEEQNAATSTKPSTAPKSGSSTTTKPTTSAGSTTPAN